MQSSPSAAASLGRSLAFIVLFLLYLFVMDLLVVTLMGYLYGQGFIGALLTLFITGGVVLALSGLLFGVILQWIYELSPWAVLKRVGVSLLAVSNLGLMGVTLLLMYRDSHYPAMAVVLCALALLGLTYLYIRAAF